MTVNIKASYARLAMTCAAKNDIRRHLQGIQVDPRPEGGAYIFGSNGHMAVVIIDPTAECSETTILAPDRFTVAHLPKVGGKGDNDKARLQLAEFGGKPALVVTDANGQQLHAQIRSATHEHKRPDGATGTNWRHVVPDFDQLKPGAADPFDFEYIGRPFAAIATRGYGSRGVSIYQAEKKQKLVCNIDGHDNVLLIIMPRQFCGDPNRWVAKWRPARPAPNQEAQPA